MLVYESGTIGSKPRTIPLSIGDGELAETADAVVSVPEIFNYWLQPGPDRRRLPRRGRARPAGRHQHHRHRALRRAPGAAARGGRGARDRPVVRAGGRHPAPQPAGAGRAGRVPDLARRPGGDGHHRHRRADPRPRPGRAGAHRRSTPAAPSTRPGRRRAGTWRVADDVAETAPPTGAELDALRALAGDPGTGSHEGRSPTTPLPGRVVFGPGACGRLPDELDALGAAPGPAGGERAATAGRCRDLLGDRVAAQFRDVVQHVPVAAADRGPGAGRRRAAPTRCWRWAAARPSASARPSPSIRTCAPLAVPTTYAGSEMTPIWGLTEGGHKRTGPRSPGQARGRGVRPRADARPAAPRRRPVGDERPGPLRRGALRARGPTRSPR